MDGSLIAPGMAVLTNDGRQLGTVQIVMDDGFTVADGATGTSARVRFEHVTRVDEQVHLDQNALGASGAGHATAAAAGGTMTDGTHAVVRGGKTWLWPALLGLGLLALLLWGLNQCSREETRPVTDTATVGTGPVLPITDEQAATGAMLPALQAYLASPEAAPRTFTFDKLNFDTGSSAIRAEDQQTLAQVAQVLQSHPNARVRIAGYADARGNDQVNARLGQQRSQAVVAALATAGVPADRLEAATGGERNPRDSNSSAQGQFENRRTELVVTRK
jgi:outer membrane protein OmpA-like peptidoglycan-associated protein